MLARWLRRVALLLLVVGALIRAMLWASPSQRVVAQSTHLSTWSIGSPPHPPTAQPPPTAALSIASGSGAGSGGGGERIIVSSSSTGSTSDILVDAWERSEPARRSAAAVQRSAHHEAGSTDSANWKLAAELVSMASRVPSSDGLASPPLPSVGAEELALGVPVWDSVTATYVAPEQHQLPPRTAAMVTGMAAMAPERGAPNSILRALQSTAVASPASAAVVAAASSIAAGGDVVAHSLTEGATSEAAARQRQQYATRVLMPRARAHVGRQCWNRGRCSGRPGPCEWCGAALCCKANASVAGAHAACEHVGGRGRHVCTRPPSAGAAAALLDALRSALD